MNRFVHPSTVVDDLDAPIAFYTGELGLELLGRPHLDPGNGMASVDQSRDTGISNWSTTSKITHRMLDSRLEHLAFEADDLDATLTR